MKGKKRDGFIFVVVLLIFIMIFSISVGMSKLSVTNTKAINTQEKMDADYYIAQAALQAIYGSLVQPNVNGDESIINLTGKYRLDVDLVNKEPINSLKGLDKDCTIKKGNALIDDFSKKRIREIKNNSGAVVGSYQVSLELYCNEFMRSFGDATSDEIDPSNYWCYKIVSRGYSQEKNVINKSKNIEGHTLTMFVFVLSPGNPRIYDGEKDITEVI